LKEGDLIRVIADAPRPWAGQMGVVINQRFYFHRTSKVVVYLFKLKQKVPISMNNVILVSEA